MHPRRPPSLAPLAQRDDGRSNARVTRIRHPRPIVRHEGLPTDNEAEQTMGMPIDHRQHWTVEEVWALPEMPGERYEVVDGVLLVSPAPSRVHQRAVRVLLELLQRYVRETNVGEALPAPFDVVLADDTLVQPDVCVLPPLRDRALPDDPRTRPLPLLAVEVLSPSTARHDRIVKRPRYQRTGVEGWIVDIDSRLVERWTADAVRPEICSTSIEWHPINASVPLIIDLVAVFREIVGDPA